ncbi:hypothetical protein B0T19DRAFT_478823 [Cercophora scortea]|uniref:Oxidase ustYa n=1 Tax=Cercophora scortea TaxID=314031 RepID=A0AAE0I772_9PEZI|nr:hypothetical protein B0T19DRAFT_478823 [Cercophora scortea]
MFALPWLHAKQKQPLPAYASLKQEDHEASDDAEGGLPRAAAGRNQLFKKRFLISFVLNIALVVAFAVRYATRNNTTTPKKLLNSPVPDFPHEIRTFKLDPLFLSLPTNESNIAWRDLPGPNGRGFINLDPNNGFNYPDTKAGLSVFHQLHCLGALRHFMWELVGGRVDTEKMLRTWPDDITKPTYDQAIHGMWHYAHCFDYLRQAVTCSADMSLEFVSENTGLAVVDGLDFPHECKNWDAIWKYAEEYA